jgi:hypothetical protein
VLLVLASDSERNGQFNAYDIADLSAIPVHGASSDKTLSIYSGISQTVDSGTEMKSEIKALMLSILNRCSCCSVDRYALLYDEENGYCLCFRKGKLRKSALVFPHYNDGVWNVSLGYERIPYLNHQFTTKEAALRFGNSLYDRLFVGDMLNIVLLTPDLISETAFIPFQ